MSDRLKREKEYHNTAFSKGTRKKADKYYSIHNISYAILANKLEAHGYNKDVLEYGCGPGSHSFVLASYAKTVTSIDISDFAINNAQTKAEKENIKNLSFVEMDAENLKFNNETFDLIYGNAIIHHLNLKKSFPEIQRVLKKGGRAYFYEPLGHNIFINLYRKLTPRMRTVDEHPLLTKDINYAQNFFDSVNVQYFHLSTLLAVPFRNTKSYNKILKCLHGFDNFLFKVFPFLKKQAWYCVIEVEKNS